jgi:hypothetical protein
MTNAHKIAYFLKTIQENKAIFRQFLESGYEFNEALDLSLEMCKRKAAYDVTLYEVFVEKGGNNGTSA